MWLFALLSLSLAIGGTPVELTPGQLYAGGTTISVSSLGVTFTLPQGWGGGVPEGSEVLMLGSETEAGLILATAEEGVTLEQAMATLAQPIVVDFNMVLYPAGTPTRSGNTARNTFTMQNLQGRFSGFAGAIVEHGVAVSFIVVGPEEQQSVQSDRLDALLRATQLTEPPAQPSLSDAPRVGPWAARLPGMSLRYMKSSSGFYDDREYALCSDGSFIYRDQSGSFGGGASVTGAMRGSGVWSVQGDTLTFLWHDGDTTTFTIAQQNGETYLNGTRYFFVTSELCS